MKLAKDRVIQAIQDTKGMLSLTSTRLNCSVNTVKAFIEKNPEVKEVLREEREKMTDIAELALFNKIREGEAWAISLYLKTIGKNRGYVEKQELNITFEKPDKPLEEMDDRELTSYEAKLLNPGTA